MRIATGSLFVTLAVFLNSIELSSQDPMNERTTIRLLFPNVDNFGLPSIEELTYSDLSDYEIRRVRRQASRLIRFNRTSILYVRRSIIIGYERDNYIRQISSPLGELNVIYDRRVKKFKELTREEVCYLGVDNLVAKAKEDDKALEAHRAEFPPTEGIAPGVKDIVERAIAEAKYYANLQVAHISLVQSRRQIRKDVENAQAISGAYREKFIEIYNHVLRESDII